MNGRPARTSPFTPDFRKLVVRRLAAAVGLAFAGASFQAGAAPIFWNAGTGNWFEASNWDLDRVPVQLDDVIVSNGGTAQLAGQLATPSLGSLNIGVGSSGTGTGFVISDGVKILSGGGFSVGTVFTSGTSANGGLDISDADAEGPSLLAGTVANAGGAASAQGRVSAGGSFILYAGPLRAGQVLLSGRGSEATGSVAIGGNAGTTIELTAGEVVSNADSQVGSKAEGGIRIGGDLALAPSALVRVGVTRGEDRFVDPATSEVFVNEARGRVEIGGTLSALGNVSTLSVGTTTNGIAQGSFIAGALDLGDWRIQELRVGTSQGGTARGEVSIGGGDVNVGILQVGVTNTGSAQGRLSVGGTITGNNTNLQVGMATNTDPVDSRVDVEGTVQAKGLAGFRDYFVGFLTNVGAGSRAQGRVTAVGAGTSASAGSVQVGVLSNTADRSSAVGELDLGDAALEMNGVLRAGQIFQSGRGSEATGTVTIGGNAGTVVGLTAGEVASNADSQIGSKAEGGIRIGGDLALISGAQVRVGVTAGVNNDRFVDPATSEVFVNEARGRVEIGGTLSALGDVPTLNVGTTFNGIAEGSFIAGALELGAGRIERLLIGTSQGGTARGEVSIGSGDVNVGILQVGITSTGSARGRLTLESTNLNADDVVAGIGADGRASIALTGSTASVTNDFTLLNGELALDNTLLSVGDELTFGAGATLLIDINGLTRGSEYGAIDARFAMLDGVLMIDLQGLDLVGDLLSSDLLRSGDVDGITGDFEQVRVAGLPVGYSWSAGVELDEFEVFRLWITRQGFVPEPGTWTLLLGAGLAMIFARRRGR